MGESRDGKDCPSQWVSHTVPPSQWSQTYGSPSLNFCFKPKIDNSLERVTTFNGVRHGFPEKLQGWNCLSNVDSMNKQHTIARGGSPQARQHTKSPPFKNTWYGCACCEPGVRAKLLVPVKNLRQNETLEQKQIIHWIHQTFHEPCVTRILSCAVPGPLTALMHHPPPPHSCPKRFAYVEVHTVDPGQTNSHGLKPMNAERC